MHRSIPYGVSLRIRRICSEPAEFHRARKALEEYLVQRSYPRNLVHTQILRVCPQHRHQVLAYTGKRTKEGRLPFVLPWSPRMPEASSALSALQVLLRLDRTCGAVPKLSNPLLLAYRRPRILREHLVRAQGATSRALAPSTPGFFPCTECSLCTGPAPAAVRTTEFTSPHRPGATFHINSRFTCSSSNIIYLVTCAFCGEVAVGETGQTLKARMNMYRSNILPADPYRWQLNDTERHFCQADHVAVAPTGTNPAPASGWRHFRVTPIDSVHGLPPHHPDSAPVRRIKEYLWQTRLGVRIQSRRAANPYALCHRSGGPSANARQPAHTRARPEDSSQPSRPPHAAHTEA